MINDRLQKQEGGNSSTNLQGQSIVVNQGISYSDARDIALDIFKANFIKLSQDAAEIAKSRAEEITDKFLSKLREENESALGSMNNPGMQMSLYEAQKGFAKTGDENLENILVDILVDRAGIQERNIRQIVLDESITIAPKLTEQQIDTLTVIFLITRVVHRGLVNIDGLKNHLETQICPFAINLTNKDTCYQYLQYAACGSLAHQGKFESIEALFKKNYSGLFSKGFSQEEFEEKIGGIELHSNFIIKCLHNNNLYQTNAIDNKILMKMCQEHSVSDETQNKLIAISNSAVMNKQEVRDFLINLKPELEHLFMLWDSSKISCFVINPVGIAIAQANLRAKIGLELDLSIWVN